MSIRLSEEVVSLLNDTRNKKVLASVDNEGTPHIVFKNSLRVDSEGNIRYFELLETSVTNRNLTNSLWFRRPVSINVLTEDNRSYQIKGIPVRAIICGREFQDAYIAVQAALGETADLSTVWVIEPGEIREETPQVRRKEHNEKYPLVGHLDRYVLPDAPL
jgi:hypothetical protein